MAISINEFLAEKRIHVVPQPPCSPDLSPCDLFLCPQLKNHLKGCQEAFQHCYEQWKQCLRFCVAAHGNYFEEDNLDL
jgi:transposase